MADELIDICDENMKPLGQAMKSLAHRTGLWHQAIHCWFFRRDGKRTFLLFQKRGAEKELFPDYLDITAAGHYQAGEQIRDGVREILEELGENVPFESLVALGVKIDLGKTDSVLNREFCHVFLHETKLGIKDFSLNSAEVEGLVEIEVADGLALFSGNAARVEARGISWDRAGAQWQAIQLLVDTKQFIPRIDAYYYKMFSIASRCAAGDMHLAI